MLKHGLICLILACYVDCRGKISDILLETSKASCPWECPPLSQCVPEKVNVCNCIPNYKWLDRTTQNRCIKIPIKPSGATGFGPRITQTTAGNKYYD